MFKSLRNYHLIMIVWLVVEILIGLTYFIVNIETAEQVVTITVILSLVLGNFIIVCLYIFYLVYEFVIVILTQPKS